MAADISSQGKGGGGTSSTIAVSAAGSIGRRTIPSKRELRKVSQYQFE